MSPDELPVVEPSEEFEVVLPKIPDLAVPNFTLSDDATRGYATCDDILKLVTDVGE